MILYLRQFVEIGITWLFEDVEFRGINKVRDITFEEELVLVIELNPTTAFDNVEVFILVAFKKQI